MGHPVHSELGWAPGRLVVMNIVGAATWSILWTSGPYYGSVVHIIHIMDQCIVNFKFMKNEESEP